MIATEIQPSDPAWLDLCAEQYVALVWGPDNLTETRYLRVIAGRGFRRELDEA